MRPPREHRRGTITADPSRPALNGFATSANALPATRGTGQALADLPGKKADAKRSITATAFQGDTTRLMNDWMAIATPSAEDFATYRDMIGTADTEGHIDRPNPENLPAVISTAITASGDDLIVPEWHQVQNLPGYAASAIRQIGRMVFGQFTDTPIDHIQTVTTLTNDTNEVKALMHWISKNGIRDDRAEFDFGPMMVQADVQLWNVENYSFLLVKDPYGHYVYGWPGGRGVHLEEEPPRPMLR